jgi:hypothetical protein
MIYIHTVQISPLDQYKMDFRRGVSMIYQGDLGLIIPILMSNIVEAVDTREAINDEKT